MFTAEIDHPYHGEITLEGSSVTEILAVAMKYDHDCEDTTGCDVANMTDGGFLLIATSRMFGSTECPTLQGVVDALPAGLYTRETIEADENAWWDTVKDLSVFCPECRTLLHGVVLYLDEIENLPNTCTNCLHSFDPSKAERPSRGR